MRKLVKRIRAFFVKSEDPVNPTIRAFLNKYESCLSQNDILNCIDSTEECERLEKAIMTSSPTQRVGEDVIGSSRA